MYFKILLDAVDLDRIVAALIVSRLSRNGLSEAERTQYSETLRRVQAQREAQAK